MLIELIFLTLFGMAAYHDNKNFTIPDMITSVLWILAIVFYPGLLAMSFAIVFLINTIIVNLAGNPLITWGDILIIPPFMSFMTAIVPYKFGLGIGVIFICVGIFVPIITKKDSPVAVWMFTGAIVAFLFSVLPILA